LDLLGFIRPNPDFSTGCGGKSKKIPVSLSSPSQIASARSGHLTNLPLILIFRKHLRVRNSRGVWRWPGHDGSSQMESARQRHCEFRLGRLAPGAGTGALDGRSAHGLGLAD